MPNSSGLYVRNRRRRLKEMATQPMYEGMEQRYYRPEELHIDEAFNVRPQTDYNSDEQERRDDEKFSYVIERDGQMDPIRIVIRDEQPPKPEKGDKTRSELGVDITPIE